MAADAAYPTVLNDAGASRQLDGLGGWIWTRDETDQRIVDETLDGSGSIIFDHATFRARAWPVLTAGTAHPDTDADGMPDAWENSFGLDPLSDDAALDPDADVYTNLEEYLNATSPIVTETNACHASALSWGSSKSELTWQAPALFHCSSVFDVARGNVAQLRAAQGDFSGAACLENDTGSNSSIDPLEPPPNAANWYLVRVDGETWRTGAPAETGQRDTSLTICP